MPYSKYKANRIVLIDKRGFLEHLYQKKVLARNLT